jgi:hypothetical protein
MPGAAAKHTDLSATSRPCEIRAVATLSQGQYGRLETEVAPRVARRLLGPASSMLAALRNASEDRHR